MDRYDLLLRSVLTAIYFHVFFRFIPLNNTSDCLRCCYCCCCLSVAAVSPSDDKKKVYWWLSFVTSVDESGAVMTSADVCTSHQMATLYHPADVLSWDCEYFISTPCLICRKYLMDAVQSRSHKDIRKGEPICLDFMPAGEPDPTWWSCITAQPLPRCGAGCSPLVRASSCLVLRPVPVSRAPLCPS